jgi:hypothetical protein
MLMATALRCRDTKSDFLPQYNAFVTKHNVLLGKQNAIVRSELAKSLGAKGAISKSDNLSVGFANTYGAGHATMNCSALKVLATKISISDENATTLSDLADQILEPTEIPGTTCAAVPMKFASK